MRGTVVSDHRPKAKEQSGFFRANEFASNNLRRVIGAIRCFAEQVGRRASPRGRLGNDARMRELDLSDRREERPLSRSTKGNLWADQGAQSSKVARVSLKVLTEVVVFGISENVDGQGFNMAVHHANIGPRSRMAESRKMILRIPIWGALAG